jgi:hypothetical protein
VASESRRERNMRSSIRFQKIDIAALYTRLNVGDGSSEINNNADKSKASTTVVVTY